MISPTIPDGVLGVSDDVSLLGLLCIVATVLVGILIGDRTGRRRRA